MQSNIRNGFDQPMSINMDGIKSAFHILSQSDDHYPFPNFNSDNDNNFEVQKIIPNKISSEKDNSISTVDLTDCILKGAYFALKNDVLYVYDKHKSYYVPFQGEYADKYVRINTPDNYKYKINKNTIREIIQWIKASPKVKNFTDSSTNNLIAFNDCIYNYETNETLYHSPKMFFTSLLNVNYYASSFNEDSEHFEKFMYDITCGDIYLYNRIQEMVGYIISERRNLKTLPFIIGPKDSESIFLRLIEYIVGEENSTSLSIDQLSKPDYLVKIIGKRLNMCAEVPEIPLNKLDTLKKLTGGDKITVRGIYENAVDFVNSAAILLAGNDLPNIKNLDKSNAFIDRLLIIPFNNRISKDEQDLNLFEKLIGEADLIAHWAVEGIKRLHENNYIFTTNDEIVNIEIEYKSNSQGNFLKEFIDECCIIGTEYKIHYSVLEEAYQSFAYEQNIIPVSAQELHKFIKQNYLVKNSRFRLNNKNKNGFLGITLKNFIEEET